MFDLEKGQVYEVHQSQWSHSMININLISHSWAFFASPHHLQDSHISYNRCLGKCRSKWRCTTFAVAPYDGKYLTFYPMAVVMVAFFRPKLVQIANWKVCPWKFRSRSLTTTSFTLATRRRWLACMKVVTFMHVCAGSYHLTFDLNNLGQSYVVDICHSIANINLCNIKSLEHFFC